MIRSGAIIHVLITSKSFLLLSYCFVYILLISFSYVGFVVYKVMLIYFYISFRSLSFIVSSFSTFLFMYISLFYRAPMNLLQSEFSRLKQVSPSAIFSCQFIFLHSYHSQSLFLVLSLYSCYFYSTSSFISMSSDSHVNLRSLSFTAQSKSAIQ